MSYATGKDFTYEDVTLSDERVVKNLILYRSDVDPYYFYRTNNCIYSAGDVQPLHQGIIALFADLDVLIDGAELTDEHKAIIKMAMSGYTVDDIANELGETWSYANSALETASGNIVQHNDQKWKYEFVDSTKKKADWAYKKCSRCGKDKPGVKEFYRSHPQTRDGFQSRCRPCEKI